jgi:hypothetical protein
VVTETGDEVEPSAERFGGRSCFRRESVRQQPPAGRRLPWPRCDRRPIPETFQFQVPGFPAMGLRATSHTLVAPPQVVTPKQHGGRWQLHRHIRRCIYGLCVAVDVHYLRSGGVRAAAVVAADAAFSQAQMPEAGRGEQS